MGVLHCPVRPWPKIILRVEPNKICAQTNVFVAAALAAFRATFAGIVALAAIVAFRAFISVAGIAAQPPFAAYRAFISVA